VSVGKLFWYYQAATTLVVHAMASICYFCVSLLHDLNNESLCHPSTWLFVLGPRQNGTGIL